MSWSGWKIKLLGIWEHLCDSFRVLKRYLELGKELGDGRFVRTLPCGLALLLFGQSLVERDAEIILVNHACEVSDNLLLEG